MAAVKGSRQALVRQPRETFYFYFMNYTSKRGTCEEASATPQALVLQPRASGTPPLKPSSLYFKVFLWETPRSREEECVGFLFYYRL